MTIFTVRLLFSLLSVSSICAAKSFKRQSNGGGSFGMQNGGSNSAPGSFSGGAGGGMAGGGSGGGNGFSDGSGQGNGAGSFVGAKGNNDQGGSPFLGAAGGDGSGGAGSPFNMISAGKLSTGPGGLAGGSFATSLNNGGGAPGQGQNNDLTVDNSRFDTTAYQQTVNQLFNTNKNEQELKDMGSPFDGNSYELPQDRNDEGQGHHNTANEASLGSYADMTAYGANSGQAMGGQSSSKNPSSENTNFGSSSSNEQGNGNYQNEMARPQGTDTGTGNYASPFDVNNYDAGKSFSSSSAQNSAKSPFVINSASSSIGDQNPFKITSGGQNHFDTSSFQAGSGQYQSNTEGLDDFGNVDFGKLSRLSGNSVDNGLPGSLGTANFNAGSGSSYSGFQNAVGSGQYGGDASESGGYQGVSESQYKTPFESENDNDLLETPFQSNPYTNTAHQNFKLPYATNNNPQRTNFGANSAVNGYSGGMGSGPAGDPMNQGGNLRGRRSTH